MKIFTNAFVLLMLLCLLFGCTSAEREAFSTHSSSQAEETTIPESVTYIGEHVFEDTGYYKNEANWENDMLYIGTHLVAVKETISGNHTVKAGGARFFMGRAGT